MILWKFEKKSFSGINPFDSISKNVTHGWLQEGFEKFPKCFYVFVGEKNAEDMEGISETVEVISNFFGKTRPTSIVVMGKYSPSEIENISSYFSIYPMVCVGEGGGVRGIRGIRGKIDRELPEN